MVLKSFKGHLHRRGGLVVCSLWRGWWEKGLVTGWTCRRLLIGQGEVHCRAAVVRIGVRQLLVGRSSEARGAETLRSLSR